MLRNVVNIVSNFKNCCFCWVKILYDFKHTGRNNNYSAVVSSCIIHKNTVCNYNHFTVI